MTEQPQDNLADDAIKTLLQLGLGHGLLRIAEMLLNADPYERAQTRTGHANGFKPRSLQTAIGELNRNCLAGLSITHKFQPSKIQKI